LNILLDTQAFIWFVEDDPKLTEKYKANVENIDNRIIISIASLWEMTIKMSLGKLNFSKKIDTFIDKLYKNGFEILPILPSHLILLSSLPYHNRDPFDRIIAAQALSEKLQIVSSDEIFDLYDVKRL